MILNKIYHKDWLDNDLPDKCANLIIADPPYFEVKGEFDFIWDSFEDYLKDVEKWAVECKRILADNGTILWYGSAKNIAYAQIIFDKYFNLINNLVWNKGSFMGLEESEGLRSFAPCTERILMYGGAEYQNMKNYVNEEVLKLGDFKHCDINKKLGFKTNGGSYSSDILNTKKTNWKFPVKDIYIKFRELGIFKKDYDLFRRPFNNTMNLQEILNFNNEAIKTGLKYNHETVKPEKLTRILILTCSRKDDLVIIPFAGSGTECAMSAFENRNYIGYDINKKYVDMSNKRVRDTTSQLKLF